ncbi:hypothetical protein [Rhizobium sp. PL01]|uniref:hypothetical protein n=1 Tax=Rhizobium sp. PL01 TaxID=3085631 RepID=UPI0029812398|nr:hypothetical protein [Rhizobium sp. PL01]MDW5317578.1 hypothetical protein [Rhizobium sp. PL01]
MTYVKQTNLFVSSLFVLGLTAFAVPALSAPLDIDNDGIPNIAEKLLGTEPLIADTDGDGQNDKADAKPTELSNPIVQTGSPATIRIVSAKVEDNFDPSTKKDVSDHLEIAISNDGKADLKGLKMYLTLTDDTNAKMESIYRDLSGFTIAAGQTTALHFDLEGVADWAAAQTHFRANENSMLYTTPSPKTLQLQIAANGEAPVSITFKKDAGGAELAD